MRSERYDAEGLRLVGEGAPAPGEIIAGRYCVVHQEDRSGATATIVAFDARERRNVRLRCLSTPDARLRHLQLRDMPGPWPRVFELCEWQGDVLAAEEFPRGAQLVELVPPDGTLAARYCLAIIYQALEALEFAHSHGIHHGSLTLHSLFIRPNGELLVLDWQTGEAVSGTRETDFTALSRCACTLLAPEGESTIVDPVILALTTRLRERPWRAALEGREETRRLFEALFSRPLESPMTELLPLLEGGDSTATAERLLLPASSQVGGGMLARSTLDGRSKRQTESGGSPASTRDAASEPLRAWELPAPMHEASLPGPTAASSGLSRETLPSRGVPPETPVSPVAYTVPSAAVSNRGECIELSPDDVVAERYRIDHLVGTGGMGQVFRAYDSMLERTVALKILKRGAPNEDQSRLAVLLSEARTAASIQHANVVAIYDVGEHVGVPYIAMEYLSGTSVRELVETRRANLRDVLSILTQVAAALGVAHRAGIIHRDVKPENIIVTDAGVAKVVDFGIATRPRESAGSFGLVGTLRYMAPELFKGHMADALSDQYSWGVLASELLAAVRVRASGHVLSIVQRERVRLQHIARRAAHQERSKRYRSMDHAIEDLRRLVGPRTRWQLHIAAAVLTCFAVTLLIWQHAPTNVWKKRYWVAVNEGSFRLALRVAEAESQRDALDADAILFGALVSHVPTDAQVARLTDVARRRGLLSELQQALLHTVEPMMARPADFRESADRLAALCSANQLPSCRILAAHAYRRASRVDDALREIQLADQASPAVELLRGLLAFAARDVTASEAHARECVRRAPQSTDCLDLLAGILAYSGRCGEATDVAKKLVASQPDEAEWYLDLARAQYGSGAPLSVAEVTYDQFMSRVPAGDRETQEARTTFNVGVLRGNFEKAEQAARRYLTAARAHGSQQMMASGATLLIELLLEEGRKADAVAAARETLGSWEGLLFNGPSVRMNLALTYLKRAGQPVEGEMARWNQDWLRTDGARASASEVWIRTEGAGATTPEEARKALTRLSEMGLDDDKERGFDFNYIVARTAWLASNFMVVSRYAGRVVRSCTGLLQPVRHTQAAAWFSAASAELGQVDDGCAAARTVLERWGNAPADSTTIAKNVLAKLQCERRKTEKE